MNFDNLNLKTLVKSNAYFEESELSLSVLILTAFTISLSIYETTSIWFMLLHAGSL